MRLALPKEKHPHRPIKGSREGASGHIIPISLCGRRLRGKGFLAF